MTEERERSFQIVAKKIYGDIQGCIESSSTFFKKRLSSITISEYRSDLILNGTWFMYFSGMETFVLKKTCFHESSHSLKTFFFFHVSFYLALQH